MIENNIQSNEALVMGTIVAGNPAVLIEDNFTPGKFNCLVEIGVEKISKSAVRLVQANQAAIDHGEEHIYNKVYSLLEPKSPIYDGNEEALRKPLAKDLTVVRTKSSTIPLLFDKENHEDVDPDNWGIGTKVKALIAFYPYSINGHKGISAKVKFMGLVEKSQAVPLHEVAIDMLSSFNED